MKAYLEPLKEISEYCAVEQELLTGHKVSHITGCIDSQKCHLIAGLSEHFPIRVIITYHDLKAQELLEEYRLYDSNVMYYPSKDVIFYNADIHGNAIVKERLKVLKKLLLGEPMTVIACIDGGIDRLLPLNKIQEKVLQLKEADVCEVDALAKQFITLGYERQAQVELPGEFAVRGGIVDIFPLTEEAPVRIELFGDEIDTIRVFDVDSQRTVERISEVTIFPAEEYLFTEQELKKGTDKILAEAKKTEEVFRAERKNEEGMQIRRTIEEFLENLEYCQGQIALDSYVTFFCNDTMSFFDYFDEHTLFVLDEPSRLVEKGETTELEFRESMTGRLEKGYCLPSQAESIFSYRELLARFSNRTTLLLSTLDYSFD